jgi:hypothetical protein
MSAYTKVRIRIAVAVTLVVLLVVGFLAFALGFLAFALGFVGIGDATASSAIPAACPQVREEPGPQPFFSNARRHPVPFTARAALLCLYKQEPSGASPGGYAEAFSKQLVITDPAQAESLATGLDAAAHRWRVFGSQGCGGGTGERVAAYFEGGPTQAVEVVISDGGCASARNGGNDSYIGNSDIFPNVMVMFGCRDYPGPAAAPPNWYCGL